MAVATASMCLGCCAFVCVFGFFFRGGFHRELIETYGMQLSCFRIIQSDFPFRNRPHTHTQNHTKSDNNELTTTKLPWLNIISSVLMKWFHLFRVYMIFHLVWLLHMQFIARTIGRMTTKTIEIFNQLMVTDDGYKSPSISR